MNRLVNQLLPFDSPESEVQVNTSEPLSFEVIRSPKRKKSSQASLVKGLLRIRIPSWFNQAQEAETVEYFLAKFERERSTDRVDLKQRAARLVELYSYLSPTSIRWVSNQAQQWGSCTPQHGSIRLSDRLATYPDWVIDYVICHELAHLSEPNHSPQFWELVSRYPRTERARGYLIAKGLGDDD